MYKTTLPYILLFLTIVCNSTFMNAQSGYNKTNEGRELNQLRETFLKGQSEQSVKKLMGMTEHTSDPVSRAYFGASKTMMAEHMISPWSKYSFFSTGTEILDASVQQLPNNFDNRALRLSIQLNCPNFLNYHQHILEDFEKMVSLYPNVDMPISFKEQWIRAIVMAGKESEKISVDQLNQLNALLRLNQNTSAEIEPNVTQ